MQRICDADTSQQPLLAEVIVSAKGSWSRILSLPLGMRAAGQEQAQVSMLPGEPLPRRASFS
jgi:hypothetical protein